MIFLELRSRRDHYSSARLLASPNAENASECRMSVNTVKARLKNIYAKLGVSARAGTVERAAC